MRTFDEYFTTQVDKGDTSDIKSAIIGFIDTDKYQAEFQFRQAAAYAQKQLIEKTGKGLIEKDDGKWSLSSDKQEWNEALWQTLKVELMYNNFSQEKLNAMESLMRHLRSTGVPCFQVEDNAFTRYRMQGNAPISSEKIPKKGKKKESQKESNGLLPSCLAAGAVAGLVIGTLIKAKLVGVVIGCVAGAGVYKYLKEKANK